MSKIQKALSNKKNQLRERYYECYTYASVEDHITALENLMIKMAWDEYRRFSQTLSTHHLTFPQFHTLITIKKNEVKCTMGLLADKTKQVSATMTGIIDRLVEQGLVERWRHPEDRRKVLVRLTEAGHLSLNDVFTLL